MDWFNLTGTLKGPNLLLGSRDWLSFVPNDAGVRKMYLDRSRTFLLKIDPNGYSQAHREAWVWANLADEDRAMFTPVRATGKVRTPEGDLSFVITDFLPLREPEGDECQWGYEVLRVGSKYGLLEDLRGSEYHSRQWKMCGDLPIIHDYGFCNDPRYVGPHPRYFSCAPKFISDVNLRIVTVIAANSNLLEPYMSDMH